MIQSMTSQPGSEWWRNTFCYSSVNHRSPASSCLTGCSLPFPCFSSLQSSSPPKFARVLLALSIFFSSNLIQVPFPLPSCLSRRKRKRKNEHDPTGTNTKCLLHAPLAAAFTTGCGRHAKNARTCQSSKPEVPVVLRRLERHRKYRCRVPANLLGRVDPELQQNPCPDSCQGLPMFNWRKCQHDSDVELTRLRSRTVVCCCCTCHISIYPSIRLCKTGQSASLPNSSAKNCKVN